MPVLLLLVIKVCCVLEPKDRLCVSSAHSFLWFMPEQPHQLPLPPTLHILRRKRITQCSYILHGSWQ